MNNYFVHFAGKWIEGRMWKTKVWNNLDIKFYKNLQNYYKKRVYGNPAGFISDK